MEKNTKLFYSRSYSFLYVKKEEAPQKLQKLYYAIFATNTKTRREDKASQEI
jgi:hypothetical protein